MCRVASGAPPNFPRGLAPRAPQPCSPRPGPGPGVPFPDESSDVIRGQGSTLTAPTAAGSPAHTLRRGTRAQGAAKGRAELPQSEQVPWSAGPRQAICTRRGRRHEDQDLRQEALGARALGLCRAEELHGPGRGRAPRGPGAGLPAPCPSGSAAAASLRPFAWTLPRMARVATSPGTLVPPPARAPRTGRPLPQSLQAEGEMGKG